MDHRFMAVQFKDYFSTHAQQYAQYRPGYPPELYRYLAEISPAHRCAWDCATGSGQAALALTLYFGRIIATDASVQQLRHAAAHEKVDYCVCTAENAAISDSSVNLITVAQALHWFDFEKFYREVRRVLTPGGVLSVWCYSLASVTPAVDAVVQHFYKDIMGPYWPPERTWTDTAYRDIPFPFSEIGPPDFFMCVKWKCAEFMGYLGTWSAVQKYRQATGTEPLSLIARELKAAWGDAESRRKVQWPLHLRIGRI